MEYKLSGTIFVEIECNIKYFNVCTHTVIDRDGSILEDTKWRCDCVAVGDKLSYRQAVQRVWITNRRHRHNLHRCRGCRCRFRRSYFKTTQE